MLPTYRQFQSFGSNEVLDEMGLRQRRHQGTSSISPHGTQWITNTDGEVIAYRAPSGKEATPDELHQDALRWEMCFARDVRACHAQSHKHECTATCSKYAKPK